MKKKVTIFPIVLSVIAIVLGAYATFTTYQLKQGGQNDAAFKADVFKAIDEYVAEKSGRPAGPVDVSIDDDPMKGDKKAPVTIVEFTDYQCPFCARYTLETLPQITKDYIDTGKVRYVLRDFPLGMHPDAASAANAAECIRAQGGDDMYFDYHDVLFANQTELSPEKLKAYAADFNVNQNEFSTCVDNNEYAAEIQKDFSDGSQYGVQGTPAFFINGMPFFGAQPYENFKAAIEEALANKK